MYYVPCTVYSGGQTKDEGSVFSQDIDFRGFPFTLTL